MTTVTVNVHIDGHHPGDTIEVERERADFYVSAGYAQLAVVAPVDVTNSGDEAPGDDDPLDLE